MKNKFKFSLLTSLLLALTFLLVYPPPPDAKADVGTQSIISSATFTNDTTRTTGFTDVKIDKQDNIGVLLSFQGNGSGSDEITVTFARSGDGTTFETTPRFTWAIPANGTTAVVAYTNLSSAVIGSAGYLRVISVQNASTNRNMTNSSITIIKKTVKPSP